MEGDDVDFNISNELSDGQESEDLNASTGGNEETNASKPKKRSTWTRGATTLTKIKESKNFLTIESCPDTGLPIGSCSSSYSNWVGKEARSKFSIFKLDWHKIDDGEKDRFWVGIKWNIEDDTLKEKTMSIASGSWRSFKSKLELSQKNKEHAKMNDHPHHLRGYLGKRYSFARIKERGLLLEINDMYSKRTCDFISARLEKSGPSEFILPDIMKSIVGEMTEKDKQFSQGDWDRNVAIDPLEAMLGPEHSGHTKGVSHIAGLRVGLDIENKRRKRYNKVEEIKELKLSGISSSGKYVLWYCDRRLPLNK